MVEFTQNMHKKPQVAPLDHPQRENTWEDSCGNFIKYMECMKLGTQEFSYFDKKKLRSF